MAIGKVAQVIGTVVDVEFPPDQLPNIFDALNLDNGGENLVLEVQQHIGNNWVRCLALAAEGRLADYHENADAALWLTGEVANDLEVKPVDPSPRARTSPCRRRWSDTRSVRMNIDNAQARCGVRNADTVTPARNLK